ncbi:MAG: zinc ribbon domain-containing protein [Thermomicrobiales bacterium]
MPLDGVARVRDAPTSGAPRRWGAGPSVASGSIAAVTESQRCAGCGAMLQPGDRFCPVCGAGLVAADAVAAAAVVPVSGAQAQAADPGWFVSTRASSMIVSAVMLFIGALLLLMIGQIDRTGTIGIISLLILEFAVAMLLAGVARGIYGTFARG